MRPLDLIVIAAYLILIATVGLRLSGRQRGATDYFVGERNLPWWAVCFSIVATETSTLTVISVPGVAYMGAFVFVELAIGYLIGRTLVAFVLLPLYMRGDLVSAYQFLGKRFGPAVQGLASVTFLITRLLAEGVRLFASAIPVALLLDALGLHASYMTIITALVAVTVVYTYFGGIRAVIWTDAIQMGLYLGGALLCVLILLNQTGLGGLSVAYDAGKFQVLNFTAPILTSPFAAVTAIFGGAAFAMASHGADQLIVQRVLACRSLRDGQQAMIGSAIAVMVQFALFSLVGALLWVKSGGAGLAQMNLTSPDQLFPNFILHELPQGLSGLLIAGILAATMGSLSSALNSLSNSTVADLIRTFSRKTYDDATMLKVSRVFTLIWAVAFVLFALPFTDTKSSIIVLGLGIAGYTYGALLGSFLLGILVKRANQRDGFVAFLVTVLVMAYVVLEVTPGGRTIAFPWYVPIGVCVTLAVGGLMSLTHPSRATQAT